MMPEAKARSRPVSCQGPARSLEPRWVGLTALTVLFGMQSLRALMPLAIFVLRDRFGWHSAGVGLVMLAVLATGFLAAPVRRAAGVRRFLQITAGGLGLARLALQLWAGDPLVDLGLTIAAVMLFFFALPALVVEAGGGWRSHGFILGWLTGLAADSALHGTYATWDMSWRSDPATLVTVMALVAVQWRLLALAIRGPAAAEHRALPYPVSTWAALGPLLFLELLVLGNVARLTALTGWDPEWGALWVVAGRILAVGAVMVSFRGRPAWASSAFLVSALVASLAVPWPRGVWAACLQLAGLVFAAVLWAYVADHASTRRRANGEGPRRPQRFSVSHGLGLLTFGVLIFLYYAGFDIRLPFSKDLIPQIAALALGAAGVAAARSAPALDSSRASDRRAVPPDGDKWRVVGALSAVVLLLLPAGKLLVGPETHAGAEGFPLRIMTYNLHLGIDPWGRLDLEQIAATIEAEDPDLVALQEVPRGWVVTGSVDTLAWLSRRLGMSYRFGATADPLWGNAILSRRPFLDHQTLDLPTEDLLIRRGFLSARIDLGKDGPFEAIVTHFHHLGDGGEIRQRQSRAILDFWQGRERSAILGDFNARPGEPEIEMLRRAGLGEVLDLAGVEPGYTHSALEPVKRIDYIWISPDLVPRDVAVPSSTASDHLPVVATLDLGPGC